MAIGAQQQSWDVSDALRPWAERSPAHCWSLAAQGTFDQPGSDVCCITCWQIQVVHLTGVLDWPEVNTFRTTIPPEKFNITLTHTCMRDGAYVTWIWLSLEQVLPALAITYVWNQLPWSLALRLGTNG
jgi:hypothetical protein